MNHHRQTKDSQTHLFVVLYLKQQFRVVLALAVATNEDVLAAIEKRFSEISATLFVLHPLASPTDEATQLHHKPTEELESRAADSGHFIRDGARKKTHSARVEVRLRTNTEES